MQIFQIKTYSKYYFQIVTNVQHELHFISQKHSATHKFICGKFNDLRFYEDLKKSRFGIVIFFYNLCDSG